MALSDKCKPKVEEIFKLLEELVECECKNPSPELIKVPGAPGVNIISKGYLSPSKHYAITIADKGTQGLHNFTTIIMSTDGEIISETHHGDDEVAARYQFQRLTK